MPHDLQAEGLNFVNQATKIVAKRKPEHCFPLPDISLLGPVISNVAPAHKTSLYTSRRNCE
jgi:hypothetical protein